MLRHGKKHSGHQGRRIIVPLSLTAAALIFSGCCSFSADKATGSTCSSFEDGSSPLSAAIHFYQGPLDHLSAVRFGECPMHPHCSEYALEAFRTHGVIPGWFMTCDRLMRCGRDEVDLSPEIFVDGQWKTLDPVDRNDIWRNNSLPFP
jgi:putative component of membrane protein insertase Oxa1/YidC/SpoIIIJ protein YidD